MGTDDVPALLRSRVYRRGARLRIVVDSSFSRRATIIAEPHRLEVRLPWGFGTETFVLETDPWVLDVVEGESGRWSLRIRSGGRVRLLGGRLPGDEALWLATAVTRAIAGLLPEARVAEPESAPEPGVAASAGRALPPGTSRAD